jgi:hypothetical protein
MIFYKLSNKAKAFENMAFDELIIYLSDKLYQKNKFGEILTDLKQVKRPGVFLMLQIWSTRENFRILSLNEV